MLGARPILCAVLEGASLGSDAKARARELFEAGVDWIQLRDRSLDDADLWCLLTALVTARDELRAAAGAAANQTPRVIVNKRVDLARAAGADGVHLGFDSLGAEASRSVLGPGALIGASLHSVEEVSAVRAGVLDYAHLAPIWPPLSKRATRPALGLEALAAACRTGLPILAQGGVDAEHARQAVRAGAAGVAVTGILQAAGRLPETIGSLRASLDDGRLRSHG